MKDKVRHRKAGGKKTLVYLNGGSTWYGNVEMTPSQLKDFGRSRSQKWMYSGHRLHQGIYSVETNKEPVVVFDTESWSAAEKTKRKKNGFTGIRVIKL